MSHCNVNSHTDLFIYVLTLILHLMIILFSFCILTVKQHQHKIPVILFKTTKSTLRSACENSYFCKVNRNKS